jgi:hypothetical protein
MNVARMRAPIDSPEMADFVARLDEINALAEAAPGFVWRYQTAAGNATDTRPYDDDRIIVNFSVWASVEALHAYVFRSEHAQVMRQRRRWFEQMAEAYTVLWWIPAGHRPTVAEAVARLAHLRAHGPTPEAFTFRQLQPPPDHAPGGSETPSLPDECPA